MENSVHLKVIVSYDEHEPIEERGQQILSPREVRDILNDDSTVVRIPAQEDMGIIENTEFEFVDYNFPDVGFHIEQRQESGTGVRYFRAIRCEDWNPMIEDWPPQDIPISDWKDTQEQAIMDLMDKVIHSQLEEE